MAYRTFVDPYGTSWNVWDVLPVYAERRARERRVMNVNPQAVGGDDRRAVEDRRQEAELRGELPPELVNGWLVFESRALKRRYWPVPVGWEAMSIGELCDLCEMAVAVEPYPADVADLAELDKPHSRPPRA